jgi:hypothetical protein
VRPAAWHAAYPLPVGNWLRAVAGVSIVVLVAGVGIAASFALLRLTQDSNDPVGKLSPRVEFVRTSPSASSPTSLPSASTSIPSSTVKDTDDARLPGRDGDD